MNNPKKIHVEDNIEKTFGRLTIIEYAGENSNHQELAKCKCSCGNEVVVPIASLTQGKTKSCGCYKRDIHYKTHKKFNEYYIYNNIVFVKYTNCNEYFICDLDDWNNLKQYAWYKHNRNSYPCNKSGSKIIMMHNLIMDRKEPYVVDHIYQVSNGVCDNRKSNLRLVSQLDNSRNCVISKNNTSGYNGVSWSKQRNKWIASITVNRKSINLGGFENIDDAVKARKEAEEKYW